MLIDNELVIENLEGYRITVDLAANASSHIFLGESISPTAPCQRVVIKLLHTGYTNTPQERQYISQALSSLQQLSHPHILPILSTGIYKDMPYIITEYLAGGSLQDHLQRRQSGQPLGQEEAVRIFTQIAQALHYAHRRHIVHGNLKPQNVLFNTRGEVVLTDIHLYNLLMLDKVEDAPVSDMSGYRAPEQIAGSTSEEADQYALGCIAYELFTGHKAFMIPSVNAPGVYYRTKALIAPGRLNPDIPPHIEDAILKALSKESAQRHRDILSFLTALEISPIIETRNQKNLPMTLAQIVVVSRNLPVALELTKPEPTNNVVEAAAMELPLTALTMRERHPGKARQALMQRSLLAVVICLVIITAILETLFTTFRFPVPTKKLTENPRVAVTTVVTPSPKQTRVPVPTATATTKSTIPITPLPTPNVATPSQQPTSTAIPTPVPTTGPVSVPPPTQPSQVQIPLASFFNNVGIGNAPGQANFDGAGFSYVAGELPPGGPITLNGVSYQFPNHGPGTSDNVITSGQTIPLTPGNYQQASLLMSTAWGPWSGSVAIHYTDNSTTTTGITVLDWCLGPSNGLSTVHRYNSVDTNTFSTYIYVIPITLDPARRADALILPQSSGHIRVFAITMLS